MAPCLSSSLFVMPLLLVRSINATLRSDIYEVLLLLRWKETYEMGKRGLVPQLNSRMVLTMRGNLHVTEIGAVWDVLVSKPSCCIVNVKKRAWRDQEVSQY